MKKCELLSPAGNMEMLKYAIMNGADAIYLAGPRFGARKFAKNFSDEELIDAVKFAHLYGVKIYVTINTLVHESEIEDFIDYAKFIYHIGVDAVLIQDFGMLNTLHKIIPDLELHASTQMHNNGKNIVRLLEKCGVKRIVLDREMILNEIKKLPKSIEKEVFCHGALCISYSGQCLMSSFIMDRSGNRGECAGLCRLPYKLESDGKEKDKKYYLSLKDINTTDYIPEIIASGVDSLKIEGRMKSPEYVGYMTKIYRKLIDSYYDGTSKKLDPKEQKNIKLLFNRGFTKGYILNADNESMINRESPNHIGIHLGTYQPHKNKIKITLGEPLEQGDAIRFKEDNKGMTVNFLYDKNNNLINKASKHETVYIDNFLEIEESGELRKVSSISLIKEIAFLPTRKVDITGIIKIAYGKEMELTVMDGKNKIIVHGSIPSYAKNKPVSKEDIYKQLTKTGSTVYNFTSLNIELENNLFVNLKDLNLLRREALELLDKNRTKMRESVKYKPFKSKTIQTEFTPSITVVLRTKEQLEVANKYTENIFTTNRDLQKDNKVYIKYDENPECLNGDKCMISDLGSLEKIRENQIVYSDYMLNVTNSHTANALIEKGVSKLTLSVELNKDDIKKIAKNTDRSHIEVLIYGHVELMKMKFDPDMESKNSQLIDRNNSKYKIIKSSKMNYIMSPYPVDKIEDIEELLNHGIANFRIDLLDETPSEVEDILKNIYKQIYNKR